MREYFVDLHVHIGRTLCGLPVKITAAKSLTVPNILDECAGRKGIDIVGIVDASAPGVQQDLLELLNNGELVELEGGGLRYKELVTLILGAEIETTEILGQTGNQIQTGNAHCLCFFPDIKNILSFTKEISKPGKVKNPSLSSQRANIGMQELWKIVNSLGGILIPAHCFTPHKGVYGNCVSKISSILSAEAWKSIPAIELGLSSDSDYADMISELADKTFVSNSDAHSLPKIAREYNIIRMVKPDYTELVKALRREDGRAVAGNYGFDPKLGKYHRTYCEKCSWTTDEEPPVNYCKNCGAPVDGRNVIRGVLDRIYQIRDNKETLRPEHRPYYVHQIPLQNIPGIGQKTLNKLLSEYKEMEILHKIDREALIKIAGAKTTDLIVAAREGKLEIAAGGGGHYGKVTGRAMD